jgi:acyl carrier protein phosphodiesterase
MNYLGHLILSGTNEELMVGNFIGDHVTNKTLSQFSLAVQSGIHLHREIDIFTDTHSISRSLRGILFKEHRHRSRVILDLFYDHFLAADFDELTSTSLPLYTENIYQILASHLETMPISAQKYYTAMRKYGWLEQYAQTNGIRSILHAMSSRRQNTTSMGSSVDILEDQYLHFKTQSHVFFKDLFAHFSKSKYHI